MALNRKCADVPLSNYSLSMNCIDVSANTSLATDTAVDQLMMYIRLHLPEHVEYFAQHVLPKLRNNIQVWHD